MTRETQYRVAIALELLSQANVAMITAIETAVKESETEEELLGGVERSAENPVRAEGRSL